MKLTPKQSAMAPRALAFIRDDFARQDAAEVRHWGKHLHGGAGVSNVAVAEHLGTGRKDTLSLLDKLVGAGLLAQVSEHTGTTEQRRGWAGGGARNFHKEHWNYNAVTYTVRSYRVTLLGEEWLAAQVRSNPAERMTTTEALDALRDATTGEEVEAIADAYAANEKHRHWSDQDNATIIDRHAGIWYLTPPREDDNGVMQEARRSCRDKGAPSINLGREYMLPPMSVERTIRLRNLLIQSAIDRERVRSNPATPAPMEVQSILFDRELWTPPRAEAWLRRHDYAGLDLDEKPNTYRYRQHDPDLFRPRSFRTIAFGEETGIQAVVGKRKRGARTNPKKAPSAPREMEVRTTTIHGTEVLEYHVETEAHRQELLDMVETARRVLEKQKDWDRSYLRRRALCNDMAAVVRLTPLPFWVTELSEWAQPFKTWYSSERQAGWSAKPRSNPSDEPLARILRLDGARYFSDEALQHALDEAGPRSRTTVVSMSPDDFLRLAERGHDTDKAAGVESALKARSAFRDVPYLTFRNLGDDAVVTGHEGRHRAMALERRGVQLIPVRLVSQEYRAIPIRWSQWQNRPPEGEVWPARLWPEGTDEATITLDAFETRRGRSPWLPFPDSLLFPRR